MPFKSNSCCDPQGKPCCCLPENKASCMSKCQSPCQAFCKPARLTATCTGDLGKCRRAWSVPNFTPAEVKEAIKEVINNLNAETKSYMRIKDWSIREGKSKGGAKLWMQVSTWTPREWLDLLDVACEAAPDDGAGGGTLVHVDMYATGIMPTAFVGAPLINLVMCWHPVTSHDFQNGTAKPVLQPKRIATLQDLLAKQLGCDVTQVGGDPDIAQYSLLNHTEPIVDSEPKSG